MQKLFVLMILGVVMLGSVQAQDCTPSMDEVKNAVTKQWNQITDATSEYVVKQGETASAIESKQIDEASSAWSNALKEADKLAGEMKGIQEDLKSSTLKRVQAGIRQECICG